MSDPTLLLAVLVGFALVIVGGWWLGAGTTGSLRGLWPGPPTPEWPHGVQESDAPHFSVDHLDALRPGTPMLLDALPVEEDEGPRPEMVELVSRRLDRAH